MAQVKYAEFFGKKKLTAALCETLAMQRETAQMDLDFYAKAKAAQADRVDSQKAKQATGPLARLRPRPTKPSLVSAAKAGFKPKAKAQPQEK